MWQIIVLTAIYCHSRLWGAFSLQVHAGKYRIILDCKYFFHISSNKRKNPRIKPPTVNGFGILIGGLTSALSAILISKTCSSFCSASLENLSSVSSLHSLTETVFHLSLSLLRLVCSKHICTSFYSHHVKIRVLSIFSSHIIIQIFMRLVNSFFVFSFASFEWHVAMPLKTCIFILLLLFLIQLLLFPHPRGVLRPQQARD